MSVVPREFQYSLRPKLPNLKCTTTAFVSNSLTYASGSQARLDIPSLKNTFIDVGSSYLRFTLTVANDANGGADTWLDHSAHSLVSGLQVYSAGQSVLLENMNAYYNVLACALTDLLASPSTTCSALSIFAGTSSDTSNTRNGYKFTGLTSTSVTFCIPLVSGVLGVLMDRHVPASGYTVMLNWETAANAFYAASGAVTYSLSNVEYVASLIECPDDVYNMIVASSGSPDLSIPTTQYRVSTYVSPANQLQDSILLSNARFSFLKNILACPRSTAKINAQAQRSISTREKLALSSYIFRVGSQLVPVKAVTDTPSMASQVYKSYHAFGPSTQQSLISGANYTGSAFLLGEDFENGATRRSSMMLAGTNTLGTNVYLDLTHSGNHVETLWTIFSHFDSVLTWSGLSLPSTVVSNRP